MMVSPRNGRVRDVTEDHESVASQGLGIGDYGCFVPLCASYAAKHIGWPQGGRKVGAKTFQDKGGLEQF